MHRSFKILSVASLSAALALTLITAATFAAEAHPSRTRRPRDLATAYEAIYRATYATMFTAKNPILRGRRARRLAVDAIATSVAGDGWMAQSRHTPADEAAKTAAISALNAGPSGFQNCRVMFAYRDAYWAAYNALPSQPAASPDQAAGIAALAVARAVAQQIAADESAAGNAGADNRDPKADDVRQMARDQHRAAYEAAYKAVYQIMGTDSKTPEYDHCTAAYAAAKSQLLREHVDSNEPLVAEIAITALFDAAHDWVAKRPHPPK